MSDLHMGERYAVHLDELRLSPDGLWLSNDKGQPIRVGWTAVANGCFDGMHPGHLSLFAHLDTIAYRKRLRPIVAINSDQSVRRLKGPPRPVWSQEVRSAVINCLKWPLTVVIFDEDTPQRLMDLLRPAVVVKGAEYAPGSVVRWKDSEVFAVPMLEDWSTSRILGDTR